MSTTMFSKHRIEALSDAVFAIAMTLLILDIKVPTEMNAGGLGNALLSQSHEWISFVITFGLTSLFWTFQHRVFDLLDEVGKESLALTFLFLGFVTVLPFTTALWGHHIGDPVAYMLYFLNQFLIAAALLAKVQWARAKGHMRISIESDLMRLRLAFLCAAMGSAAIASRLMPTQYVALVSLPIVLVGRHLRLRQRKRQPALPARPAQAVVVDKPHPTGHL